MACGCVSWYWFVLWLVKAFRPPAATEEEEEEEKEDKDEDEDEVPPEARIVEGTPGDDLNAMEEEGFTAKVLRDEVEYAFTIGKSNSGKSKSGKVDQRVNIFPSPPEFFLLFFIILFPISVVTSFLNVLSNTDHTEG